VRRHSGPCFGVGVGVGVGFGFGRGGRKLWFGFGLAVVIRVLSDAGKIRCTGLLAGWFKGFLFVAGSPFRFQMMLKCSRECLLTLTGEL
jgi:hypothetical protein